MIGSGPWCKAIREKTRMRWRREVYPHLIFLFLLFCCCPHSTWFVIVISWNVMLWITVLLFALIGLVWGLYMYALILQRFDFRFLLFLDDALRVDI